MGAAKRSTWITGTVFLALASCAAAWFLVLSPMFESASGSRAEAASTRQQNQALEAKIIQLKVDFAKLPEYKAQLATIRGQIPTDAALSAYLRELDGIATARSVVITAVSPATPVSFVPVTPVALAAPAATGATATPAATSPAPAAPAATAPVVTGASVPTGFASIPFSISVVGTYENTLKFLDDLQNKTARLLLVSGLVGTSQDVTAASGGRPATALGDLELVITGFAYVLPDPAAVPAAVDTTTLPAVVAGKNPLIPVGGK